jgi:zinc D-Ala-D-Ala dipeptidase
VKINHLGEMNAIRRLPLWAALAALLAFCACQSGPPREQGEFRSADLVELVKLDPTIHLDIRYATTNNLMHRPMYPEARSFLQRPAAQALMRVNQSLKAKGYGLLVFDGYRPWSVTKAFWDSATQEQRDIEFVANPRKGSKHNRGCAVDLTLFALATGAEVAMPSTYDEFSERAFPSYQGGSPEARARRELLREAMEAEGFTVYKAEWWHFDYKDWAQYRILDIPFAAIGR